MAKTVLVAIADGIEEIESVCIIDVLRRAGAEVTAASVDGLEITASRGVRLVADTLISDCVGKTFDLITLPGGMPGAGHLRDNKELVEMLKKQQQENRLYAAICASPAVVLAHHGLLKGKKATCHPLFTDKLPNTEQAESRVVVDGNCVTSRGPGTAMEFALKLTEQLFGKNKALEIAKSMIAA